MCFPSSWEHKGEVYLSVCLSCTPWNHGTTESLNAKEANRGLLLEDKPSSQGRNKACNRYGATGIAFLVDRAHLSPQQHSRVLHAGRALSQENPRLVSWGTALKHHRFLLGPETGPENHQDNRQSVTVMKAVNNAYILLGTVLRGCDSPPYHPTHNGSWSRSWGMG